MSDGSLADPEVIEPEASGKAVEEPKREATEPEASSKAVEEAKEETTEPEASGAEEDIDAQVAEAEESETPEEPEDPTADPAPDKKAYASVLWDGRLRMGVKALSRNGQRGHR